MARLNQTGKKGVTTEIVFNAYKTHLLSMLDEYLDRVYMQDNAKVHTGHVVINWLDENGYSVMLWPPYLPDLNLIECVWYVLKTWMHKHYPELRIMKRGIEDIKQQIVEAVEEAWKAVRDDYLWKFMESMPKRVQAVLKARGGYTIY